MNLRGSKSFIIAVVPFDQIAIDFGGGREASQFTSASGALQWTSENLREGQSRQTFPKPPCVPFASLSQWQISQTRMLAGQAPSSLAMAREVKLRKNSNHVVTTA